MTPYELRVMSGPNMWSGYHQKLIVLKLDYGNLSEPMIANVSQSLARNQKVEINQTDFRENPLLFLTGLLSRFGAFIQSDSEILYHDKKFVGKNSYYAIFQYEEEEVGRRA